MGGEVVGINTDTLDNNEAGIKEAKEILKAQGASYKNLTFRFQFNSWKICRKHHGIPYNSSCR